MKYVIKYEAEEGDRGAFTINMEEGGGYIWMVQLLTLNSCRVVRVGGSPYGPHSL